MVPLSDHVTRSRDARLVSVCLHLVVVFSEDIEREGVTTRSGFIT
jgi:hypothetical protein